MRDRGHAFDGCPICVNYPDLAQKYGTCARCGNPNTWERDERGDWLVCVWCGAVEKLTTDEPHARGR